MTFIVELFDLRRKEFVVQKNMRYWAQRYPDVYGLFSSWQLPYMSQLFVFSSNYSVTINYSVVFCRSCNEARLQCRHPWIKTMAQHCTWMIFANTSPSELRQRSLFWSTTLVWPRLNLTMWVVQNPSSPSPIPLMPTLWKWQGADSSAPGLPSLPTPPPASSWLITCSWLDLACPTPSLLPTS